MTASQKTETWWQNLNRYSAEGMGTDVRGLTANRNRSLYGALLAVGVLALIAPDIMSGPQQGLPDLGGLVAVSGRLLKGEETNQEIRLWLDGQQKEFDYPSKAEAFTQVFKALCKGCDTTVWVDPNDAREKVTVFQIAVSNRTVRSYADVKAAWMASNRIGQWIAAFLLCSAGILGAIAWRQYRLLLRLKRGNLI
jgi:hypothetical protein